MKPDQIRALVAQLNTRKSLEADEAWAQLRDLGVKIVPYLVEGYEAFNLWQGRVACVYYCVRYARVSQEAFELGVKALADRATLVRYRACALVAYSLKPEAIPALEGLLDHKDQATAEDAAAAIRAIKKQNHNLFIDRDPHSRGNTGWIVTDEDMQAHLDDISRKPSLWERLKNALGRG